MTMRLLATTLLLSGLTLALAPLIGTQSVSEAGRS